MTEHQPNSPDDLTTPQDPAGAEPAPLDLDGPVTVVTTDPSAAPPAPEVPPLPELDMVTITWRNIEFQIPKCRLDWDMNVQFEFEEGARLRGMMTLLGGGPAGRYAVRQKLYTGGVRTAGELDEFFNHAGNVAEKECTFTRDEEPDTK